MRIGITGANGFIARHVADSLVENKRNAVFGCSLPACDLLNFSTARRFVKSKDVIVHTAAVNRGSDMDIIAGSIVTTHNLIRALEGTRQKTKIIFLSSVQAESDTVYGLSKRLCEIMLQDFSKRNNSPVSILRLANVFGEGGKPFYNSVVATFCYQIANGQDIAIHDPKRTLNFVYVGDAVVAILREVYGKRAKSFYFKRIVSKDVISIGKLAKMITGFSKNPHMVLSKTKFEKNLYKVYQSYQTSRHHGKK